MKKIAAALLLSLFLFLAFSCADDGISSIDEQTEPTVTASATATKPVNESMPPVTTTQVVVPASSAAQAFQRIASGDFSLIKESYLAELCAWGMESGYYTPRYVVMDFNQDGVDDMYIQLSPNYDSALLRYADGLVECVYLDAIEGTCYNRPLKDGRMLQWYSLWPPGPSQTFMKLDSEYNWIVLERYQLITVNFYDAIRDESDHLPEVLPDQIITHSEIECYGFYELCKKSGETSGKEVQLSEKEWWQAQDKINELLVADDEFLEFKAP